jgi:hypothetical protein
MAEPDPVRPTRYEAWYGRERAPDEVRPVSLDGIELEIQGIDVRRMRAGAVALVDRIYVAVRDPDWGTVTPVISGVEVGGDQDQPFRMTFDARHVEGPIAFAWQGSITLDHEGTLRYVMDGVAESDFRYCRIGLCVLHSAGTWAGRSYRATGGEEPSNGALPELIGPQPIVDGVERALFPPFNALTLAHDDLEVDFRFEGDLFETEDQRNWTDDSFKTYSTPIALGYPHAAHAGQRIRQQLSMQVRGTDRTARGGATTGRSPVELRIGSALPGWPRMGLGASSDVRPLGSREVELLRPLAIDHLRVDVRLPEEGWQARLALAGDDAAALGVPLEIALIVAGSEDPALPELVNALTGVRVARVLVFDAATSGTGSTPSGLVSAVRARLGSVLPGARWIGGTDGDFADLNRSRPDLADLDGVCWSINPQVHASDERSMAETLPAQAIAVATVHAFAPGLDTAVSPVTLRQRFNPVAEGPPLPPPPGTLPPQVDLRQPTLFGAGWTLGSLASLTGAGATSVTLFETCGWRGLAEWTDPPDRPGWHGWTAGTVFPMYHVLADLGDRTGGRPVPVSSSSRDVVALGIQRSDGLTLLLANLAAQPVECQVPRIAAASRVRILDERSIADAMHRPAAFRDRTDREAFRGEIVGLEPYASARVDVAPGAGGR